MQVFIIRDIISSILLLVSSLLLSLLASNCVEVLVVVLWHVPFQYDYPISTSDHISAVLVCDKPWVVPLSHEDTMTAG